MSQLANVVKNILALSINEQVQFARAFRDSFLWDSDDDLVPNSASYVAHQSRQPMIALHSIGVILDRDTAYAYLSQDLHAPLGRAAFNKKLTNTNFVRESHRSAERLARRHVFTYAEIRMFFAFRAPVEIPDEIRNLAR
jgi:hypothetical protein